MSTPAAPIYSEQALGTTCKGVNVYCKNQYREFSYIDVKAPYPGHVPSYYGFGGFQLSLKSLWDTTVDHSLWMRYARRFRIPAYNAFQKVNNPRYKLGLSPLLEPPT